MKRETGKVRYSSNLGTEKLQSFFIQHLNRIYCAKAHLVERLPDIAAASYFQSARLIIDKTILQNENQIESMDQMYRLFNTRYSFKDNNALIDFLENAFITFQWHIANEDMRNVMMLSYLGHIESLENSSVYILKLLASKLNNDKLNQLLNENLCNADHTLTTHITNIFTATS